MKSNTLKWEHIKTKTIKAILIKEIMSGWVKFLTWQINLNWSKFFSNVKPQNSNILTNCLICAPFSTHIFIHIGWPTSSGFLLFFWLVCFTFEAVASIYFKCKDMQTLFTSGISKRCDVDYNFILLLIIFYHCISRQIELSFHCTYLI